MNGLAILLCTLACGADVRESIPSTTSLYDVIDHSRQLSTFEGDYRVLNDGARLEQYRSRYSEQGILQASIRSEARGASPLMIGKLRVVPIPGHPNIILAGFVSHDDKPFPHDVAWPAANIWLDVDRNAVIWEEGRSVPHFLSEDQLAEIHAQVMSIAEVWAKQIVAHRDQFPADHYLAQFHRSFVDPPKTDFKCQVLSVNVVTGKCEFELQMSGGGRSLELPYHAPLLHLLTSELAIPAEQYFAAKPTNAVEKETE